MTFKDRYFWRYPLAMSCLLAVPVGAQAAQTAAEEQTTAAAVAGQAVQLKRVKVSATRPLVRQQTTLSSQVDGKTLEQERLYRFEDLPQAVTGMDIAAADTLDTRVTIRGIGDGGGSEINIGMPSSVGLFLDGVRLSRPGMLANDLLDIDSVNVLKGPQGTLYGFNTTGGAIDIRSRKPTFTPEYSLE
ncbi:MAG: TonB-dependent receptor plug domain-containing protein, partial [Gibbsiella quercinecans]|uniref:TonB-dependent receptor plug domain-containing protein n=1 Tax=Gibbsiella quercinecans TaxID=929813 RepID=UPI003F2A3D45